MGHRAAHSYDGLLLSGEEDMHAICVGTDPRGRAMRVGCRRACASRCRAQDYRHLEFSSDLKMMEFLRIGDSWVGVSISGRDVEAYWTESQWRTRRPRRRGCGYRDTGHWEDGGAGGALHSNLVRWPWETRGRSLGPVLDLVAFLEGDWGGFGTMQHVSYASPTIPFSRA
jgi:hypothetical protein